MTNRGIAITPQAFFLDASPGRRFCLYYPPAGICRGGLLYVHPFAEEMNKSRRAVTLQALEAARCGYAVLLIDLFGCGDSDGDFADARWQIWLDDLAVAASWMKGVCSAPITLWGLRLGVPLMLEYARDSGVTFKGFILWQPVVTGDHFLTQFLRLRLANEMLSGSDTKTSVKDLRHELAEGRILEVAGYPVAPQLAAAVDGIRLSELVDASGRYHWFEVAPSARPFPPASSKTILSWTERGAAVHEQQILGENFWQSQEITVCPELFAATTRLLTNGI